MTLSKGFLHPPSPLKQINVRRGAVLWMLVTYIFYAFLQLYREVFRWLTAHSGDQILLELTPIENYLYNVFFGSIASFVGYSIALRFTLQNDINRTPWKTRSLARRTLHTEGLWTWYFLLWFGKLGSMMGIWYMIMAMQYEFYFLQEFAPLLVLMPFVLFYSSWPTLSRLLRNDKWKWFLGSTGLFLVMSFGLGFHNFTDYQKINQKQLSRSFTHVYDLRVPRSQSHERIYKRSLVMDFYIVRDTVHLDKVILFIDHIDRKVNLRDVQKQIAIEKDKLSTYERDRMVANLHIDERIALNNIVPVLDEFRKAGLLRIQYSTARKYSRYAASYPAWKYSGIQNFLSPYFPKFEHFLDSAEQVDLTGKRFKLSESQLYRHAFLTSHNRIAIEVHEDATLLNSQKFDSLKLEETVYQFMKKYAPNYVVVMNPAEEITYGKYIQVLDMLWTQQDRLRNEMSYALFGQPLDYWNNEMDTIRRYYGRNVLQWSTEERRLNELLRKTGYNQYGSSLLR